MNAARSVTGKVLLCVGVFWLSSLALHAQKALIGPVGEIYGVGNVLHIIGNLEKTIPFYKDVLNLAVARAPRGPADAPNAYTQVRDIIPSMYLVAPNAQNRSVEMFLATRETRLEMLDFKDLGAKAARPRLVDPGASVLVLTVRDLDPLVARLAGAGAEFVTPGGKPVAVTTEGGRSRVLVFKDPDGYFVQLIQPEGVSPASGPDTVNITRVGLALTVEDLDETVSFWRDRFGFQVQTTSAFGVDQPLFDAVGLKGAKMRKSATTVPGTSFEIQFIEFSGVERKAVHPAIHDPGATILRLRVKDMPLLVKNLRAAGVPIVSTTGEPTGQLLIARVPDNLYVQFFTNAL
jgi:catechol 2,3-dioxygenase-like lactoylglutathione lyase family enzyme